MIGKRASICEAKQQGWGQEEEIHSPPASFHPQLCESRLKLQVWALWARTSLPSTTLSSYRLRKKRKPLSDKKPCNIMSTLFRRPTPSISQCIFFQSCARPVQKESPKPRGLAESSAVSWGDMQSMGGLLLRKRGHSGEDEHRTQSWRRQSSPSGVTGLSKAGETLLIHH